MRRADPLDPAALLIDQDRRVLALERLAHVAAEPPDLLRIVGVALEEDDAPGPGVAQERALVLRELRSRKSADEGA